MLSIDSSAQQTVRLANPSFEGKPQIGTFNRTGTRTSIDGWYDCGSIRFPMASPPDLHGAKTDYWGIEDIVPFHGKSFLGLAVREDGSFESLCQKLESPLLAGVTYEFSIYLVRSTRYISPTKANRAEEQDFTHPCVFMLQGGTSMCDTEQLICKSEPISHDQWQEYVFQFKSATQLDNITLSAYFEDPTTSSYNGHLLLDHFSEFTIAFPSEKQDSVSDKIVPSDSKTPQPVNSFDIVYDSLTTTERDKLIYSYYNEGRNYGLYRYVRDLKPEEFELLLTCLEDSDLPTADLIKVEQLCKNISENGHTKENMAEIKKFDTYAEWQATVKRFLLKQGMF